MARTANGRKTFTDTYLEGAIGAIAKLNREDIDATIDLLAELKRNRGRLFILGVGGSAANASHAVNDFRKIAHIETYAPTDNVSELTARTNDDGWDTIFVNWLKGSHLNENDMIMVLSVGGGNLEKNVSTNIVKALQYAENIGTSIIGIVSRDGGYTKQAANVCILIPVITDEVITPYAESFQALLWHLFCFHPKLKE